MKRSYSPAELVTVCVLVAAAILRLALLTGPAGSDDVNYFHFAGQLAHFEHYTRLHHHGGRLAFLLAIGVPAVLLGSIKAGAILNVVLLSLRDIGVVWFVRRTMNAESAALAAVVASLNAISVTYGGLMVPDPLVSVLMFGAAVTLWFGLPKPTKLRWRWMVGAGALTAAAYSAKDAGILIALPAAVWILVSVRIAIGERIALAAAYGAGFIAVAGLEALAFWFISGDFFYRTHAISLIHNALIVESPNLNAFAHQTYWNLRLALLPDVASLPVLIAGGIVCVAALLRRTTHAFFAATGLFVGLYLIFGSSSFTRLMPLPVQDRYFEPLVPFIAVAAAALLFSYRSAPGRWPIRTAVVGSAALILGSIPSITANAGDVTFSGLLRNAAIAIRAVHASRPDLPIFVSPMLHGSIEPFVSPELYRSLRPMTGDQPVPGFYLAHPWEPITPATPMLAAMQSLPVYLVIDEDQRYLGAWSSPQPVGRGATVRAKLDP